MFVTNAIYMIVRYSTVTLKAQFFLSSMFCESNLHANSHVKMLFLLHFSAVNCFFIPSHLFYMGKYCKIIAYLLRIYCKITDYIVNFFWQENAKILWIIFTVQISDEVMQKYCEFWRGPTKFRESLAKINNLINFQFVKKCQKMVWVFICTVLYVTQSMKTYQMLLHSSFVYQALTVFARQTIHSS